MDQSPNPQERTGARDILVLDVMQALALLRYRTMIVTWDHHHAVCEAYIAEKKIRTESGTAKGAVRAMEDFLSRIDQDAKSFGADKDDGTTPVVRS